MLDINNSFFINSCIICKFPNNSNIKLKHFKKKSWQEFTMDSQIVHMLPLNHC